MALHISPLSTKSDARVWLIGDIHIGHVTTDYAKLRQVLGMINMQTDRIILMGDILECATKVSVGAGIIETDLTVDRQVDRAVEIFGPYASIIDGVLAGNHEERIYKAVGIDVAKMIADRLGVPYLRYQATINYAVGSKKYFVNVWHGNGGAGSTGNALNKCMKMSDKSMADVYAMAHTHKLATTNRHFSYPKRTEVERIKQHFVLTGSFLAYEDAYPEMMDLQPSVNGCAVINLSAKKKEVVVDLIAI